MNTTAITGLAIASATLANWRFLAVAGDPSGAVSLRREELFRFKTKTAAVQQFAELDVCLV